jgi:uncharacterized protein YoxC
METFALIVLIACAFTTLGAIIKLNRKANNIMATQDEIIAQQQAQAAKIEKIGNETRTLIDKVKELLDIINAGEVKPELKAATDAVDAQLQIVDDLVPDAP